ncbi:hypothetical protein DSCO28_33070 [Desulfosarcina ovata subsp. sediminis]|uniref:F5/8 type C domain-containing protein n=1 Tax=Desulfosarcina ovata subsp. sediminis TaxID=885957 RepID=A0A5K7ZNG6_9BACT|nr:hypothetical protein DSCO28_33070 [Desulfosarcina ovata subsp. sediminis]
MLCIPKTYAGQATLAWDANDPAPEGYRVYQRAEGNAYDYSNPAWTGTDTSCPLNNLVDGTTYAFVVRAFSGTLESADSNEVTYYVEPSESTTFSISASAETNGQIDPAGVTTVTQGDSQTYTISPAAGYEVADVLVDGESVGALTLYTFNQVAQNHSIQAFFTEVSQSEDSTGETNENDTDETEDSTGETNENDTDETEDSTDETNENDTDETEDSTDETNENDIELSLIPQSQMTVISVDSEELDRGDYSADYVIDGLADTFWHTEWYYSTPNPPHQIVIDLGGQFNVQGFRYLPRQDGNVNGTVAEYAFYVSQDGQTWQTAVATGCFDGDQTEKEVLFQETIGRYVLFEALSEINGQAWTSMAEFNILGEAVSSTSSTLISQSQMTVISVDSEELDGGDYSADYAIDGLEDTFWHTEWYYSTPNPPHQIVIDLGGEFNVQGFRYLPRQDGNVNGTVAEYAFYVSQDGQTWQTAVATGCFDGDQTEKEVLFQETIGRYVLFEALSEINGQAWTSMAELNILVDDSN